MTTSLARFTVGDTLVQYDCGPDRGPVQLSMRPRGLRAVKHRKFLPAAVEIRGLPKPWQPIRAWTLDSLVQLKCLHEGQTPAFGQGRTMRASASTEVLRFVRQKVYKKADSTDVVTTLKHPSGVLAEHHLSWQGNIPVFTSRVCVHNKGKRKVTLEMLGSFSLGGLSPFATDDAPERLSVHRFRSTWSAEGRVESRLLEDLQLERSWIGHGIACERFGQVGSMPVRGFFPFVALEDQQAGVVWGAQLACPGSWQMEIYRRDDFVALSGGLADREFGHWMKTLAPGERFETPAATLACLQGSLEQLCQRLTSVQRQPAGVLPAGEEDLPIIFNEWCTSWGDPTHDNLIALADRLKGSPVQYLVIDAGWSERTRRTDAQQNGDWIVDQKKFPQGLSATCAAIRERGLVPGIWFEFEVCTTGTKAYRKTAHQLQRDGKILEVGTRRFWDFRDPWVHDYLHQRVVRLLKDNGFGYLKVDYNDTIGLGCDGAESLGEGLRQHLEGVQRFFRHLREEMPDLVIENCSSGGHRLEPLMQSLCAMGSFSDAHETVEIPILAANLHHLILPSQCQMWAVLRHADTLQRLRYSLAATFLGRMALSGDIHQLSRSQWATVLEAMTLYRKVVPIIRDGCSERFGPAQVSFRYPKHWQAVKRSTDSGILVVAHSFAGAGAQKVEIPLPAAQKWRIAGSFGTVPVKLSRGKLTLNFSKPFTAQVIWLQE